MIKPSEIYSEAVKRLPASDIDHHSSDLYIRVTPESKKLVQEFQYPHLVTTFIDNIEGVPWFDFPFCYPYAE